MKKALPRWFHRILTTTVVFAVLGGCTTTPKKDSDALPGKVDASLAAHSKPTPLKVETPIDLKWKGVVGRNEKIRYFSYAKTRTFEGMELRHDRNEVVEFVVKSETQSVQDQPTKTSYLAETVYKDGFVSLRDMAFPEIGERLETAIDEHGEVLKAGSYPKDSIFFIPPLPLPSHPVKVGEAWPYAREWTSLNNGLKLQLNISSVIRNVFKCGKDDECYEIEITGDVTAPQTAPLKGEIQETTHKDAGPSVAPVAKSKKKKSQKAEANEPSEIVHLDSKIFGRILYSKGTSALVWSDVRNIEAFEVGKVRIEVQSCIQSSLEEPILEIWPWAKKPQCDPLTKIADPLPGTY